MLKYARFAYLAAFDVEYTEGLLSWLFILGSLDSYLYCEAEGMFAQKLSVFDLVEEKLSS